MYSLVDALGEPLFLDAIAPLCSYLLVTREADHAGIICPSPSRLHRNFAPTYLCQWIYFVLCVRDGSVWDQPLLKSV